MRAHMRFSLLPPQKPLNCSDVLEFFLKDYLDISGIYSVHLHLVLGLYGTCKILINHGTLLPVVLASAQMNKRMGCCKCMECIPEMSK